jgi:hypothetical protein
MENLFTYYYRFGRVWNNCSANKYTLLQKLDDYPTFDKACRKLSHFRPIFYQPDHVLVYYRNTKEDEPLTVLVPVNKINKIGISKQGKDTIVFCASPDYENIELFIVEAKRFTITNLLSFQQKGQLSVEMDRIRELATNLSLKGNSNRNSSKIFKL